MVGHANRPVARPKKRKVNPIVVGVGALVVLALFGFYFVWQGEQGELTAANRAVSQAIEAWEDENYDRARTEFKQVMTRWPDTAASERARASLEQLEAGLFRNRTALVKRTVLDEEWQQLTFDQFKKDYEKLRVEFEGTKPFLVISNILNTQCNDRAQSAIGRRPLVLSTTAQACKRASPLPSLGSTTR